MVSFKTKDGRTVSFKSSTMGRKKKSNMSAAARRKLSRAAKSRPRIKTGPRKGQFR